jgi:predicted phage-related endonuclease
VSRGFSAVRNLVTGDLTVSEHRFGVNELTAVEDLAKNLWSYLERGELPPAMFPGDSALWNRLHPTSTAQAAEVPVALADDLAAAKDEATKAANRYDLLEAHVKEILGDCELGIVAGVPRIRWRSVTSRRVDLKSLEAEAPDLVEAHRTDSTARRFTLVSPIHPSSRKAIPS